MNLLYNGGGAVIDVALGERDDGLVALWERQLRRMLAALAWDDAGIRARRFPGGASLFLAAPPDALYAATEINEWAWQAALAVAGGGADPPLEDDARRLAGEQARERSPSLTVLRDAARRRGVTFTVDHTGVSVGSGAGAQTWLALKGRRPEAPSPRSVNWRRVHDVPIALVTGSNGKTTTVRLMASVVRAWGRTPGTCSTDNIVIGDEVVDAGDWSGPMGARAVLRDPRVETAVLETARGGILRRGLALERAAAAIVTNVAEDHFGEWGISDLAGIAQTKLVVGRVAPRLVLNADDDVLVAQYELERAAGRITAAVGYFSLDAGSHLLKEHLAAGGTAAFLEGGDLVFARGERRTRVAAAADVPITLGGAARYNVANALGVILLASALGIHREAIAAGLTSFRGTPKDNPGRSHLWDFGGARFIVDFAHNPHGMRALIETAMAMSAERRCVVLGQAGDRDDESIRGLARETWPWRPDCVILKEMERYRRGRRSGEATGIIRDELLALGVRADQFLHAESEMGAVRAALAWARPGDLVLLPTHAEREAVLALMERLEQTGWRPGRPLP